MTLLCLVKHELVSRGVMVDPTNTAGLLTLSEHRPWVHCARHGEEIDEILLWCLSCYEEAHQPRPAPQTAAPAPGVATPLLTEDRVRQIVMEVLRAR